MAEYYYQHIVKRKGFNISYKYDIEIDDGINTPYLHKGLDLSAPRSTPIPAAADGVVYHKAYEANGFGNYIVLEHKDKKGQSVYTIYGHMFNESVLAIGDKVDKLDTIGYVGMTGNARGTHHVHFEIRLNNYYARKAATTDPYYYDLSQLKTLKEQGLTQSSTKDNIDKSCKTDKTTGSKDKPAVEPHYTVTACVEDELIIEIVGKVSGEDQRVLIYTEDNQYDSARTAKRKKPEEFQDETYQSTLHTWDWKKTERAHLWLEIAASTGEPIRVPLLTGYNISGETKSDTRKAKVTPRQKGIHEQLNLIAPFIPMTELLSYNAMKKIEISSHLKNNAPVLCAEGWVYIFKNNQLWREVQIRQNKKTGKTTYHDVRLSDYRKTNPNKLDEQADIRLPVGTGLEDIWLPARWNGIQESWQMFYAPSQLSEVRINYLQDNPSILLKRSHEIQMELTPLPANNVSTKKQANNPFLLTHKQGVNNKTIPNHIPRDFARESQLTNPTKYLTDPNYLSEAKQASQILHSYFANTTVEPDGTPVYQPKSVINDEKISPSGWAYFLKQKMAKITKAALASEKDKKDPHSAWTKYLRRKDDEELLWRASTQQPALTTPINKKICGIFLFDPLGQLQHTHQLIGQCRELQSLVVDQAMLRKNYGSAFLIKTIMLEAGSRDDESDPRYQAGIKILKNREATNRYCYAIANGDRGFVEKLMHLYQTYHHFLLMNEQTVEAIKDTTSTKGFDLLGGTINLAQLFNDLTWPVLTDPLSTPKEIKLDTGPMTVANTLLSPKNPYNNMLFPAKIDIESMLSAYPTQPIESVTVKGDGSWNPAAIGSVLEPITNDKLKILVQIKQQIEEETEKLTVPQLEDMKKAGLNTVYGQYAADSAMMGTETTLAITSKVLSTIVGYIDSIDSLIQASVKDAMQAAGNDAKLAQDSQTFHKEELQNAQQEQTARNQKMKELDKEIATNKTQQNTLDSKLNKAKNKEQTLRESLQKNQDQLAKAQGKQTELNKRHYLDLPDEEIKNWKTKDIAGDPNRAELKKIVTEKLDYVAEQDQLYNKEARLNQELEGIKNQQHQADTNIKSNRTQRNQMAQQALTELKSQKPTVKALAKTFSVEVMRQVSYSGLFELDLTPELTPEAKTLPLGVDRSIFTKLGQEGSKKKQIFVSGEASIVEYDIKGNKIAEVGWDGSVNKAFLEKHSSGNFKIRVVGYFFTANRKKSSWKDNKNSLDDVDNKVEEYKKQYNELEVKKGPLIEEMSDTERQQYAAMEGEYEKQQQQADKVDTIYDNDIANQQKNVDKAQQAVYENEQKISHSETKVAELEAKTERNHQQQAELDAEKATLQAERAQTAQLITEHQQQLETQKNLEESYHQERATLQQELNKVTNSHIGTNSLLYKLANSNSRLAGLTGLAAQRTRATFYGLLDHPLLPMGILAIEINNLLDFYNNYQDKYIKSGLARTTIDGLAVLASVTAAVEGVVAKVAWNKVAYEAWATEARREAPRLLQMIGIKVVTRRLLLVGPAAFLQIAPSLWNMWEDIFKYQDAGALVGDTIILASGLAGIAALGTLSGGTVATISSGGWALIGLVVFALGAYVKNKLSRNELEKWIDFGPFSDDPRYNLADETYAFHTLSSLLANVTAQFKEIDETVLSEMDWKVLTNGAARPKQLMALIINSSLEGLLDKNTALTAGDITAEIDGDNSFSYKPSHYFEQKIFGGVIRYFDTQADINNMNYQYSYNSNKVGTPFFGIQGFYKLTTQILVKDNQQKIWAYPCAPDIYHPKQFDFSKDGVRPINSFGTENASKNYWLQAISTCFQVGTASDLLNNSPKLLMA